MIAAFDDLRRTIDELRLQCRSLLDDITDAREAPASWEATGGMLRWHVVLRQALEPDIDVELTRIAIVVRARTFLDHPRIYQVALPIPSGYDGTRPRIVFRDGLLEICLSPMESI